MSTIRPLGDRVVVEPDKGDDRTESGLFIPESAKEKPQQGTVVAVGSGNYRPGAEERIPVDVNVGDKVIYGKYAGTDVKVADAEYKILKESDILAIIVEE